MTPFVLDLLRQELARDDPNTSTILRLAIRLEQQRFATENHRSSGGRLMAGPFAGMRYVESAHGSALLPKLVGSYENELAPVWASPAAREAEVFLQIGCAEGYYLCGVPFANPGVVRSIGVDIAAGARKLAQALIAANGLGQRCHVVGSIDDIDPAEFAGRKVFALVDVDSAELEVLDTLDARLDFGAMLSCHLLVETDRTADGASNRPQILDKLAAMRFDVQTVIEQNVAGKFVDATRHLNFTSRFLYAHEGRPIDQAWVVARHVG